MPPIQFSQDFDCPKFAVAYQENSGSFGQELADMRQECQLLAGSAVPSNLFNPGPGNWDRSLAVGQTDNHQLMTKSNPSAIHNQMDFANTAILRFQPLPGNRFVPFSYSNGRIVQQPAQPARGTRQFGFARDLACHLAQTHRAAQINADEQPDKGSNLGDPLAGTQFRNSRFPGII
jgi:hypothetical protein